MLQAPKDGYLVTLSPDGNYLVVEDAKRHICAASPASYPRLRCSATEFDGLVESTSLTWSPDGARMAFTENWAQYLQVPEVWVFDVATTALYPLTHTHVGPSDLLQIKAPLDIFPAWSPDGKWIVYARMNTESTQPVMLYRVSARGGTPVQLPRLRLLPHSDFEAVNGLQWRGNTIIYSLAASLKGQGLDPMDGIWTVDADGSHPRRVLRYPTTATIRSRMGLAGVSSDGMHALLYHEAIAGLDPVPPRPLYDLLDLRIGSLMPMRLAGVLSKSHWAGPYEAAFSWDGRDVLCEYRAPLLQQERLTIESVATHAQQNYDLIPALQRLRISVVGLANWNGSHAVWARNGLIYLAASISSALLATVQDG